MRRINHFMISVIEFVGTSPFWSNLISNLIVAVLIAIFLPWYLSYIKKPKFFEFFFRETGTDSMKLGKKDEKNLKYDIELAFRHFSGETFQHYVYWHLFIPSSLNPISETLGPNTLP